jgi:hypothetical protein
LVIDDDKSENFAKGFSTYCHQKTQFDESRLGALDLNDTEETHIKAEDVKNFTRCGAHCVSGLTLPSVSLKNYPVLLFDLTYYFPSRIMGHLLY